VRIKKLYRIYSTKKITFEVYDRLDYPTVNFSLWAGFVYIGNNISDGMPNTLLEAIVMGVNQSNCNAT
jgi:hypothetical protein